MSEQGRPTGGQAIVVGNASSGETCSVLLARTVCVFRLRRRSLPPTMPMTIGDGIHIDVTLFRHSLCDASSTGRRWTSKSATLSHPTIAPKDVRIEWLHCPSFDLSRRVKLPSSSSLPSLSGSRRVVCVANRLRASSDRVVQRRRRSNQRTLFLHPTASCHSCLSSRDSKACSVVHSIGIHDD